MHLQAPPLATLRAQVSSLMLSYAPSCLASRHIDPWHRYSSASLPLASSCVNICQCQASLSVHRRATPRRAHNLCARNAQRKYDNGASRAHVPLRTTCAPPVRITSYPGPAPACQPVLAPVTLPAINNNKPSFSSAPATQNHAHVRMPSAAHHIPQHRLPTASHSRTLLVHAPRL